MDNELKIRESQAGLCKRMNCGKEIMTRSFSRNPVINNVQALLNIVRILQLCGARRGHTMGLNRRQANMRAQSYFVHLAANDA